MSRDQDPWSATVAVRPQNPRWVGWIERALRPEASREVPRASAEVRTGPPDTIVITITARDAGALRAALNTYLGWVHLSLATARAVAEPSGSGERAP